MFVGCFVLFGMKMSGIRRKLTLVIKGSIDDSIQWLHNFERLQELQGLLIWPPVSEFEPKCYIPEVTSSSRELG